MSVFFNAPLETDCLRSLTIASVVVTPTSEERSRCSSSSMVWASIVLPRSVESGSPSADLVFESPPRKAAIVALTRPI